MKRTGILTVAGMLVCAAGPLVAQTGRAVELGVDAMVLYHIPQEGDNIFEVGLPIGGLAGLRLPAAPFRVSLPLSEAILLEPSLGFNWMSADETSFSRLTVAAHLLVRLQPGSGSTGPFAGVGGSLNRYANDESSSSQAGLSAMVGVSPSIREGLALRFAGGVARFLENDDFDAGTAVFATIGLTVATR